MVLGNKVIITVDERQTLRYPKLKDYIFPIKIGFINDETSKDKNKEVYLIGFENKFEKSSGIVIAEVSYGEKIKFVVAPPDTIFYYPDIYNSIKFLENSTDFKLKCKYEKSCGAVLYCINKETKQTKFLLIKNLSGHIGFPKGHIEYNETEIETAVREIYEETGLDVVIDTSFKKEYNYTLNSEINKKSIYFLAQFDESEIENLVFDENEIKGLWVVLYKEALELLNYDNEKNILRQAYEKVSFDLYDTKY